MQGQQPSSPSHVEHSHTTEDDAEAPSKRRKLQPNGRSAPRRKTACQSCRLRKIKCDSVRPVCGLCKAGNWSCEYIDAQSEKLTLESLNEVLCGRLDQIQHELSNIRTNTNVSLNANIQCQDDVLNRRSSANSNVAAAVEPSKDFLQIPAQRTTADAVLDWDIFESRWPLMTLIGVHFNSTTTTTESSGPDEDALFVPPGALLPIDEERIPLLVDQFLKNVHTKNPVLDVERLVEHARSISTTGLRWDGWSCLVLMAAALGTIAKPFGAVLVPSSPTLQRGTSPAWVPDSPASQGELQLADSYFTLACRRLGSLRYSVLGSQCYFFAGVYLMYTLRPLVSWQYFVQASTFYQLHMKTTHRLAADISRCGQLPLQSGSAEEDLTRSRLEESMYWSCFKSESEFRVELPLPQSELSCYAHPALFPSPPNPLIHESNDEVWPTQLRTRTPSCVSVNESRDDTDLRRHAKRLYNEEESWYYYLTEIALRRIGNRIINSFYGSESSEWLRVKTLLPIALEFDAQVSAWSANLPTAMQHWEMSETIRAPTYELLADGTENAVTRELSWATDNRLLEMRSWLYQPFLYYLIHSKTGLGLQSPNLDLLGSTPAKDAFVADTVYESPDLTTDDAALLYHFVSSGVDCNLKILDVRSLRHRHHGLWYDLRSTVCASLVLLALVKSGHEHWIPGGPEPLWCSASGSSISGKIGRVLAELDFWSVESPDMKHHRDVLEEVTRSVVEDWERRRRASVSNQH